MLMTLNYKFLKLTLLKCRKLKNNTLPMFVCRYYTSRIRKTVFISNSHDIYENLALEDWLYRNYNFTGNLVLMLWTNDPCVVIGRHQNPWVEANVVNLTNITESGVQLARRNSGGGTVYHDRGNLNLTFFTPANKYNRKNNLELIVRAIFNRYNIKIDITPREDLFVEDCKISGTAARLGRLNAYHHCTVLVDVNKENLHEALRKQKLEINTTATKSVRSKIENLCSFNSKVTVDGLMSSVLWEFMKIDSSIEYSLQEVSPTNELFPGVSELQNNLVQWDWCYGKTPKFDINRAFSVPAYLLNSVKVNGDLRVKVVVEYGRIHDVIIDIPIGLSAADFCGEVSVVGSLKSQKYPVETAEFLSWKIGATGHDLTNEKCEFITECVRKVLIII